MNKLTAADAPDRYWQDPALEITGNKWVYGTLPGAHKKLGKALTEDESFMADYLYEEAKYYASEVRTDNYINEMWTHHCAHKMNRADYETEQEWVTAYTEYARLADDDAIFHWAYARCSEDAPDYWMQIIDQCGDSPDGLRDKYPIVGCFQESRAENIELIDIRGWCPSCAQPLTNGDISWGGDLHENGKEVEIFYCGNCGSADPVGDFESKWGRPFHLPLIPKINASKEDCHGETSSQSNTPDH